MEHVHARSSVHKLPALQRRRQIIEEAMKLFSKKGFEGTTTKEIARSAGVSEAIIFRHFTTKEELYEAIIDFIIQRHSTRFYFELNEAMGQRDDVLVFETLAYRILETHREEPMLLRLLLFSGLEGHKLSQLFMETQVQPVYRLMSSYISLRVKEKAFRKAESMVLVRAFLGMVSHHSQIRVIYGDPFLRTGNRGIAREFARIFLNGIRLTGKRSQRTKVREK